MYAICAKGAAGVGGVVAGVGLVVGLASGDAAAALAGCGAALAAGVLAVLGYAIERLEAIERRLPPVSVTPISVCRCGRCGTEVGHLAPGVGFCPGCGQELTIAAG